MVQIEYAEQKRNGDQQYHVGDLMVANRRILGQF